MDSGDIGHKRRRQTKQKTEHRKTNTDPTKKPEVNQDPREQ